MSRDSHGVVIITHNRDDHLRNVLEGLAHQTAPPNEIVLVFMNQADEPPAEVDLPLVQLHVSADGPLPLAKARNAGARAVSSETVVFLDVDCIPAADFCERIRTDVERFDALVMGTPLYLRAGSDVPADLYADSYEHPTRRELRSGLQRNYDTFWSLCFAMSSANFERVGGFDENFTGYGAEDTDFARSCQMAGIPFAISNATAFHQHHRTYSPPLNHFDDIVTNAQVFFEKWGEWPMVGWLDAMTTRGMLHWSLDAKDLRVIRRPSAAEIDAALVDSAF